MPPYLNGQPVAMEGALPLGVIDHAEFTVTHFQLQENDRMVLTSDERRTLQTSDFFRSL